MTTEVKKRQTWLSIFTIEFLLILLLLLALMVFIYAAREIFVLKNFVFDDDVFEFLTTLHHSRPNELHECNYFFW